jgi:hypothetical protein
LEVGIPIGSTNFQVDLILKFGSFTTLVETKFFRKEASAQRRIPDVLAQIKTYLAVTGITQGTAIIFQEGEI